MMSATSRQATATVQEHLQELRSRIVWVVLWLGLGTAAGYAIKDQVIQLLMAPLHGANLVYLTPIGGFNFMFRICLYVGLAAAIPAIMYHIYRFLEPLLHHSKRSVVVFMTTSIVLAVAGSCFAYYAVMPASLRFLLHFDIQNVQAMLTVESYLSFVISYVLGFALLFQIPLLLLMINSINPLPPGRLLGTQRYVIVVAFIIAAVLSPTPDATNQAIMAVPIVGMYQVGVTLVWAQNRFRRTTTAPLKQPLSTPSSKPFVHPRPHGSSVQTNMRSVGRPARAVANPAIRPQPVPRPTLDTIMARRQNTDIRPRRGVSTMTPVRTRQLVQG